MTNNNEPLITNKIILIFAFMSMSVKNKMNRLTIIILLALGLGSCRSWYPNIMFKIPKNYAFDRLDTTSIKNYTIKPYDKLTLEVYSNQGYELVNAIQQDRRIIGQQQVYTYRVRDDGFAELPLIGVIYLCGYTIVAAEDTLETLYAQYIKEPFVKLEVVNRRVFVFNKSENATVVSLDNDNTSLIEVLTKAGGISVTGKAFKIRLIRGSLSNPQIMLIDLSTLEGIKKADKDYLVSY